VAKDYDLGKQRVWYRATGFAEGVTVTGRFLKPDGTMVNDVQFYEHQDGVYSTVFEFPEYGRWMLLVYEDGTPAYSCVKRIGI